DPGLPSGVESINDGAAVLGSVHIAAQRWSRDAMPPWRELGFRFVDRGQLAIFPLAVAQRAPGDSEQWSRAMGEWHVDLQQKFIHSYGGDGFHGETVLSPDTGYGKNLADAGSINWWRMFVWQLRHLAAVLVRSFDESQQLEVLSVHVMPWDWVEYRPRNPGTKRDLSRQRRIERDRAAVDASWTWSCFARDSDQNP
ncbi:MAG: hypothetical protein ACK5KU_10000, partial [Beutenbergiaceae bacterium]